MAKVNAPLLSFGASGTIGDTQTYATWRGVPYARRRVIPANPRSSEQTLTRNTFTWLNGLWKLMSGDAQAPWLAFAAGKPLTGRNAMISKNNGVLRTETDINMFTASPGAKGGLAPAAATGTGGSGTVTIAVTAPDLPTGWTITKAVGMVIPAQNPQSGTMFNSQTGNDNSAPYSIAITGLAAGDYYWAGWIEYLKPDGSTAYGPDIHGTATAT